MSKAILVLDDMPFGCRDCKLHIGIADFSGMDAGCYCLATGLTNHDGSKRGAGCPLKEMLEKLSMNDYNEYVPKDYKKLLELFNDGFNYCIDKILGTED